MSEDQRPTDDSDATRTSADVPVTPLAQLPRTIGQYRIVSKLGEGGMGLVYEAQQEHPKRRVALKVVRGGQFVDERRVRMFQREADTLARLKHPNIAAIYESGRTDDGQHFFAMELVQGETLDAYTKKRPTTVTREELRFRLALFCRIADAVHYAHQRGVIHRDLKPSNVIVTDEASREVSASTISGERLPEIKILDFGLARITEGDIAAATMTTEVGVIKGTLPYMSPEQARGNPDEIDVRTDVHALGVILYEMLAGIRPYDVLRKSVAEAVRVICEDPPRSLGAAITGVRRLDPDVETIVGKALEKEADRRYASAAALAEDIKRYLTSQPILARPPSTVYQLRKFARRNKVLVGGVAAVFAALAVGAVVSTWQAVRATRAEAEARNEAATAEQVSEFLVGLFEVSDPGEARGNTITAREILDEAAVRIEQELADQPLVQARMMNTIGNVYHGLGLYDEAQSLQEASLAIRSHLLGEEHPDVATSLNDLGVVLSDVGDFEGARSRYERAVAIREGVFGPADPRVASSLNNLGALLKDLGEYEKARTLYERALAIKEEAYGREHADVAMTLDNLAAVHRALGNYDTARPLYERSLRIREKLLGDDHPEVAQCVNNLAILLATTGDLEAARPHFERALAIWETTLGTDHPHVGLAMNNLAVLLMEIGDPEAARPLLVRALEIREAALGPDHPLVASTLNNLARMHAFERDYATAGELFERAASIGERHYGIDDSRVVESIYNQARMAALRGDRGEALGALRRAVERGYASRDMIDSPDLADLRGDPEFEAIVAELKKRIGEE